MILRIDAVDDQDGDRARPGAEERLPEERVDEELLAQRRCDGRRPGTCLHSDTSGRVPKSSCGSIEKTVDPGGTLFLIISQTKVRPLPGSPTRIAGRCPATICDASVLSDPGVRACVPEEAWLPDVAERIAGQPGNDPGSCTWPV